MNQVVKKYRKETARFFQCGPEHRKQLLRELDHCLAPFLDDISEPDLQTITDAFGSPEDLAESLMEGIPSQEIQQYQQRVKKRKWFCACLAAVLAVALLAFSVYAIYVKETHYITTHDTIWVGEESESSESVEDIE